MSSYQVGGDHYTRLAVQPWDAMQSWLTAEEFAGYLRGNAIKYLARDKGARVEDLRKARHYIDKLIEVLMSHDAQPSGWCAHPEEWDDPEYQGDDEESDEELADD